MSTVSCKLLSGTCIETLFLHHAAAFTSRGKVGFGCPSKFDVVTVTGNAEHSKVDVSSFFNNEFNYVCLNCVYRRGEDNLEDNKRVFEEVLSSNFLYGLIYCKVNSNEYHTIGLRKIGEEIFVLPREEGSSLFKATKQTTSYVLFTNSGKDKLCQAFGVPWDGNIYVESVYYNRLFVSDCVYTTYPQRFETAHK